MTSKFAEIFIIFSVFLGVKVSETVTEKALNECSDGRQQHLDREDDEYLNSTNNSQWEQSKEDCLGLGRYLTEISDFAEFELIKSKYVKLFDVANGYWLDARYFPSKGNFQWVSSEILIGNWIQQHDLWAKGYPGTPDGSTGLQIVKTLEGDLRFKTMLINYNQRYLCEKNVDPIVEV